MGRTAHNKYTSRVSVHNFMSDIEGLLNMCKFATIIFTLNKIVQTTFEHYICVMAYADRAKTL